MYYVCIWFNNNYLCDSEWLMTLNRICFDNVFANTYGALTQFILMSFKEFIIYTYNVYIYYNCKGLCLYIGYMAGLYRMNTIQNIF